MAGSVPAMACFVYTADRVMEMAELGDLSNILHPRPFPPNYSTLMLVESALVVIQSSGEHYLQ